MFKDVNEAYSILSDPERRNSTIASVTPHLTRTALHTAELAVPALLKWPIWFRLWRFPVVGGARHYQKRSGRLCRINHFTGDDLDDMG